MFYIVFSAYTPLLTTIRAFRSLRPPSTIYCAHVTIDTGLGLSAIGIAEHLTARLRRPSDKGENDVYVGTVLLPHGDLRVRAYVKVFPPARRGQLVYNEVIAQHLASQCSLPSAFTFPCACRPTLLRSATRSKMVSDPDSEFILAVASIDGTLKEIKQTLHSSEMLLADIMNWPYVAHVAVFDELLGNDDRNIGNLVRRGPHNYLMIDSERILFNEPWFDCDLTNFEGRPCDPNILADTIAEGSDQVARQRMLSIARQYVMTTLLSEPPGADILERRCGAPLGITGHLISMLNARRTRLPVLMQRHLRKGDLFQTSII